MIIQPPQMRTLALRESYLLICHRDECCAHLLNAMERMTLRVKQQRGERLSGLPFISMSAKEWHQELLQLFHEKTIRQKLATLHSQGFVVLREQKGKTPEWQLCPDAINAALAALPARGEATDVYTPQSLPVTRRAVDIRSPMQATDPHVAPGQPVQPTPEKRLTPQVTAPEQTPNLQVPAPEELPAPLEEVPAPTGRFSGGVRTNVRAFTEKQPESFKELQQMNSELTDNAWEEEAAFSKLFGEEHQTALPSGGPVDVSQVWTAEACGPTATPSTEVAAGAGQFSGPAGLVGQTPEAGNPTPETEAAPGTGEMPGPAGSLPQGELEAAVAEGHDPHETRTLLIPHLGGERKLDDLLENTPRHSDGRHHRRMWFSHIRPERVRVLIEDAKKLALERAMHPWTALTTVLDAEIVGRPVKPEKVQGYNANSYVVMERGEERPKTTDVLQAYENGSLHRHRQSGALVEIKDLVLRKRGDQTGMEYELSDGQFVKPLNMRLQYEAVNQAAVEPQPVASTH